MYFFLHLSTVCAQGKCLVCVTSAVALLFSLSILFTVCPQSSSCPRGLPARSVDAAAICTHLNTNVRAQCDVL
jgi:hypothetical protein